MKRIILLTLLLMPLTAYSHSGRLDAQKGHHIGREYHYHLPDDLSPAAEKYQQEIAEYFRQANENVGALECDQVHHKRNLSSTAKERIIQHHGRRCVICGSTDRLEVDHRRALMNGGENSPSNLSVLCDDCHTTKTRMDNSLRRKRERLCRSR